MIEAGRIDHASHDNNIEDMLRETLMLDECVGELLSSPLMKETLVVITADHETAGLAISHSGHRVSSDRARLLRQPGFSQGLLGKGRALDHPSRADRSFACPLGCSGCQRRRCHDESQRCAWRDQSAREHL